MRFPRKSYDEIMAAEDWNEATPEMADAVTDGLAADLAKPGRRITATQLQKQIICETCQGQFRVFGVYANDEDSSILEARDALGKVWASAMTIEGLRQQLYGMTLPE